MDAATFRKLGHELIDWVADYRERVERLPVMSPVKPGEIRARFPTEPPRAGGGSPPALERLDERRAAAASPTGTIHPSSPTSPATPATRRSWPTSSPPGSARRA